MSREPHPMNDDTTIDDYLRATGGTLADLMTGVQAFGLDEVKRLVIEALRLNKRIIWQDEPARGLDAVSYRFENIL